MDVHSAANIMYPVQDLGVGWSVQDLGVRWSISLGPISSADDMGHLLLHACFHGLRSEPPVRVRRVRWVSRL